MRILNILLGVMSIIVAGICFANPFSSQLLYGYVIAVLIGVVGIASIVRYFMERSAAKANGLTVANGSLNLIVGIFGVVFMVLNMTVPFFTYTVQEFGAILVAMFMVVEGASCIINAVVNKNGDGMFKRVLLIILGIAMVVAFVFALAFPAVIISMFGIFLGASLLVQGMGRILFAIQMP